MKRSSSKDVGTAIRALLVCAGLLFFASAPGAFALSIAAHLEAQSQGVFLDIRADDPPIDDVLRTVQTGMRAEVVFTIQIYRHPGGIIRLLGDRLVQEIRITREGRWDAYGGQYVVSSSVGPEIRTRNVDDFTSDFFHLTNFLLPWSFLRSGQTDSESPAYMMMRLQVRPMKLVSALAILSFLRLEKEISSTWVRIPIPEGDPKAAKPGAGR
ncbi:MAG TPA: hypothetical protein VMW87_15270 [Spirochaetia bacterium]|nr:hypothetical protein [Spirochaetia bacterium]